MKPHIKLIDRRKKYEERKLNFIAGINVIVGFDLGLTVSTLDEAKQVLHLIKTASRYGYLDGISKIKINQFKD